MAEFVFTSPEGQKFRVRGPDGATPEQAFQLFQSMQGQGTPAPVPQEQAIPQGDWGELKGRISNRVDKERNIVGPVREQDLAEVAKAEAARQGQIYGKQYGKDESGLGILGGSAFNTFGASLPRLAEAYLGQNSLPGAQAHEFLKGADQGRAEARPAPAIAGTVGGILGQVASWPVSGAASIGGRALAAGAQAGLISAVDKAAETRGDVGQTVLAGGLGMGLGAVGSYGIDKGIQAGRRLIDPMRGLAKSGPVQQQAAARVLLAAKNAGIDDATAKAKLAELGPDGFLADIMGTRGQALARTSANLSPDAREILEGASTARLGGQTERLTQSLADAGNVPIGTMPDELIEAIKTAGRPKIAAAYETARKSGATMLGGIADDGTVKLNALNNAALDDLFMVPRVKNAIKQAMDETTARVAIEGPDAASHWATLDRARQILADEGFRTGDSVSKGLAKKLNEALDLIVPEGSAARGIARQNIKAREAVEFGAQAAKQPKPDFARQAAAKQFPTINPANTFRRPAMDMPAVAPGTMPDERAFFAGPAAMNRQQAQNPLAQGYAAQQIARLLGTKGGGNRAVDLLDGSDTARNVLAGALGKKAAPVQRQVGAERQFVRFNEALKGNSTTARQLIEAGAIGGSAAGGYMAGFDPMAAGSVAGLAVMARRGGSKLFEVLARKNESAVAPEVARRLIERELPKLIDSQGNKLTETARRRLAEALLRQTTKATAIGYGTAQ